MFIPFYFTLYTYDQSLSIHAMNKERLNDDDDDNNVDQKVIA